MATLRGDASHAAVDEMLRAAVSKVVDLDGATGDMVAAVDFAQDQRGRLQAERRSWLRTGKEGCSYVVTRHRWSPYDEKLSTASPLQPTVTFSYDVLGRVMTSRHGLKLTQLSYDRRGRVIFSSTPDGMRQQTAYDCAGLSSCTTHLNLNATTTVVADLSGRKVFIRGIAGEEQTFQYDHAGHPEHCSRVGGQYRVKDGKLEWCDMRVLETQEWSGGRLRSVSVEAVPDIGVKNRAVVFGKHCEYGPKLRELHIGGRKKRTEQEILAFNRRGEPTQWRDANDVIFDAKYDGMGNVLLLEASGKKHTLHRRLVLRDVRGLETYSREQCFYAVTGEGAPRKVDTTEETSFSYDGIGNLRSEGDGDSHITYAWSTTQPQLTVGYMQDDPDGRPQQMKHEYHYNRDWRPCLIRSALVEGNATISSAECSVASLPSELLRADLQYKPVSVAPGHTKSSEVADGGIKNTTWTLGDAVDWTSEYGAADATGKRPIAESRTTTRYLAAGIGAVQQQEKLSSTRYGQGVTRTTTRITSRRQPAHSSIFPNETVENTDTTTVTGATKRPQTESSDTRHVQRALDVMGRLEALAISKDVHRTGSQGVKYSWREGSVAELVADDDAPEPNALRVRHNATGSSDPNNVPVELATSTAIARYADGTEYQLPGLTLCRDVFGRPVAVQSLSEGRGSLLLSYDSHGRLVRRRHTSPLSVPKSEEHCNLVYVISDEKPDNAARLSRGEPPADEWFPPLAVDKLCNALRLELKSGYRGRILIDVHRCRQWGWLSKLRDAVNEGLGQEIDYRDFDRTAMLRKMDAAAYPHITVLVRGPADRLYGSLEYQSNLTIIGANIRALRLRCCHNVRLDSCTFSGAGGASGVEIVGIDEKGEGIKDTGAVDVRVVNCRFRDYAAAITIKDCYDSKILLDHNSFRVERGRDAVYIKNTIDTRKGDNKSRGITHIGIVNNVFFLRGDGRAVLLDELSEGSARAYGCFDCNCFDVEGGRKDVCQRKVDGKLSKEIASWQQPGDNCVFTENADGESDEAVAAKLEGYGIPELPQRFCNMGVAATDYLGRVRNRKATTIGPLEAAFDEEEIKYSYSMGQVLQKRVYRRRGTDAPALKPAEGTVYVAGLQGNTLFARDGDGTLDACMPNSDGGTGFWYRAGGGDRKVRASAAGSGGESRIKILSGPTEWSQSINAWDTWGSIGMHEGIGVADSTWNPFLSWQHYAVEPDVAVGRRGCFGRLCAPDLSLSAPDPLEPEVTLKDRIEMFLNGIVQAPGRIGEWWSGLDWSDPTTCLKAIGGGTLLVAGVALTVMSAGTLSGPGLGLAAIGLGLAGLAIGGAAVYGGYQLMSHASDPTYGAGDLFRDYAIGGIGGLMIGAGILTGHLGFVPMLAGEFAAGTAGGTAIGLLQGESFGNALTSGVEMGIMATVTAAVLYGASAAARALRRGAVGRAAIGTGGTATTHSTEGLWRVNRGGPRSIEEAIEIAKANGVRIPRNVRIVSAEVPEGTLAYWWKPRTDLVPEQIISLRELQNIKGQWLVRVGPRVLESDDAILAVLRHELWEVRGVDRLMTMFGTRSMTASTLQSVIDRLHNGAVFRADKLVNAVLASG